MIGENHTIFINYFINKEWKKYYFGIYALLLALLLFRIYALLLAVELA